MSRILVVGDVSHKVYLELAKAFGMHEVRWISPHEYPVAMVTFHSLEREFDYFIFLLTRESHDFAVLRNAFKTFPNTTIISLCLDQDAYEDYALEQDITCHFWPVDMEQMIDLVNRGVNQFVNGDEIEV